MDESASKRQHAIVIGGSIAGLMTARMLSDHFAHVTILERDPVGDQPEARKGQLHARHTHVILDPVRAMIRKYLPEVEPALIAEGAVLSDAGADLCWFSYEGYRSRAAGGFELLSASRSLFEYHVRKAVLRRWNVRLLDQVRVDGLLWSACNTAVAGVRYTLRQKNGETGSSAQVVSLASLVVDGSGRGSALPKWLQQRGYTPPQREEMRIGIRYATRIYRRHGVHRDRPEVYFCGGTPPKDELTGAMVPVEDACWSVTLAGRNGRDVPADSEGFVQALRNLPSLDIYRAIAGAEPLSEPSTFGYPRSHRYRYDRMRYFPRGVLPIGDAVASFNPVYGQGMSAAALQVECLDGVLRERSVFPIWERFFARQGRLVGNVWSLAVGEDCRFPDTVGHRPLGVGFSNRFGEWVNRAAQSDERVARQLNQVLCLRAPASSLMKIPMLWHIWKARRGMPHGGLSHDLPAWSLTAIE